MLNSHSKSAMQTLASTLFVRPFPATFQTMQQVVNLYFILCMHSVYKIKQSTNKINIAMETGETVPIKSLTLHLERHI